MEQRLSLVTLGVSDLARARVFYEALSPAETVVPILGKILAVRAGRAGGRLKASKSRMHAEVR